MQWFFREQFILRTVKNSVLLLTFPLTNLFWKRIQSFTVKFGHQHNQTIFEWNSLWTKKSCGLDSRKIITNTEERIIFHVCEHRKLKKQLNASNEETTKRNPRCGKEEKQWFRSSLMSWLTFLDYRFHTWCELINIVVTSLLRV